MTAGQIARHLGFVKPMLSAHFAVLREADLAESEGTSITYSLRLSVLEDAPLSFAETVGIGAGSDGKGGGIKQARTSALQAGTKSISNSRGVPLWIGSVVQSFNSIMRHTAAASTSGMGVKCTCGCRHGYGYAPLP